MSCPFNSNAGFNAANIQLPSTQRQLSGLNSNKLVYPPDNNMDSYTVSMKGRGISDSTVLAHTSEYRTSLGVDASTGYNIGLSINDTDGSIYGTEYKPRFNNHDHNNNNSTSKQSSYGSSVSGKSYTKPITYWDYIHPDVLCTLQSGRENNGLNHHDEHLFIIVHQVFELWFKQLLYELEYVRDTLHTYKNTMKQHSTEPHTHTETHNGDGTHTKSVSDTTPLTRCVQRLHRCDSIMRLATEGYSMMETMSPTDFLEFRDYLSPSSGFQSVQLREIEILLGLQDSDRILCSNRPYREAFIVGSVNKTHVFDKRMNEPTLLSAMYDYTTQLYQQFEIDIELFFTEYMNVINTQNNVKLTDSNNELHMLNKLKLNTTEPADIQYIDNLIDKATLKIQSLKHNDLHEYFDTSHMYGKSRRAILLLSTYPSHPLYATHSKILDGLARFESAITIWRNRHARMVELFIGRKVGTGGTSGVEYIDETALYRVLVDLWKIRGLQVAASKIKFNPYNVQR